MIIAGLGSYLPDTILDNTEIERRIPETSDSWIQQKLGIKQRRIADPSVCASDLAFFSSIKAISDASLTVEQIDLIIVATSTPDRISPSTACILQEKLKAKNAAAFDINAVCSGFLYGLHISNAFLKSGIYKNILLVASEVYSKIQENTTTLSGYRLHTKTSRCIGRKLVWWSATNSEYHQWIN